MGEHAGRDAICDGLKHVAVPGFHLGREVVTDSGAAVAWADEPVLRVNPGGRITGVLAGGHAVISTNNLASWHNVVSLVLGWQPTPCHVSDEVIVGNPANAYEGYEGAVDGQQHLRVFTGRALAGLAAFHGLTLDLDRTAGYYPLPVALARVMTRIDRRHAHRGQRRLLHLALHMGPAIGRAVEIDDEGGESRVHGAAEGWGRLLARRRRACTPRLLPLDPRPPAGA